MEGTTIPTGPKSPVTNDREVISPASERQSHPTGPWLRAIGMIWNVGLAVIFAYWANRIIPKILPQFLDVRWDLPPSLVVRTIYIGIEGFGLLIGIGLFFLSLSTIFWKPVHHRWRWLYGVATIVFLLGVAIGVVIDRWDMGFAYIEREFVLFVLVMSFPIVVFGTGYLGLPGKVWHRIRRRRQSPGATASD